MYVCGPTVYNLIHIGNARPMIAFDTVRRYFEYKGFDLSIFCQWSYGNDVLNANRLFFENVNNSRNLNQYATYADRWTPENPTSNIPVAKNSSSNKVVSSRVIEDGSFLRLKNLMISYTFPQSWMKKTNFFTNARIYAQGQNLLTFTKFSGLDPEAFTNMYQAQYPMSRQYSFGLELSF